MDTKKISEITFEVEDLANKADILQNTGLAIFAAMFEVNGYDANSFKEALFGLTHDMFDLSKRLNAVSDSLFEMIKED